MERREGNEAREFSTHEPHRDSINQASGSTSNVPAISSNAIEQHLVKYNLSKKACVVVFHHNRFDNPLNNRAGSQKDLEKITIFFRDYRIDWNVHENQSAAEVRSTMDKIALKDFSDFSCLIIIIMSHGHEGDQIVARDGEMYCFKEDIVEKCTSNRSLDAKPKLFIVQACRGDTEMEKDAQKQQIKSKKIDVLIFQSTYQGFYSYRHQEIGTFFIQHFFDLLDQHRNEDISHINKHLNRVFSQKGISQTPTMTSTLRSDLMFGDLRRY